MKLHTIFFGFIFIISISLAACNPTHRVARIADKYNLSQLETITLKDTVYIPQKEYFVKTQIDSFGVFFYQTDTVFLKGKIKDSIVEIIVATPADTVYIEKDLKVKTITVEKQEKPKRQLWLTFLFFAGFCVVSTLWLKDKFKQNN